MALSKTLKLIALTVLTAVLTTTAPGAHAVEKLLAAELDLHCKHYTDDPDGLDGTFCTRYIQGFIDGAVATDERVMQNVRAEYEPKETITQRAMRLRGAGSTRFPTYYAEFCLGEPVPLKAVVETVVEHFEQRDVDSDTLLARAVVDQVLRDNYPCVQEDLND